MTKKEYAEYEQNVKDALEGFMLVEGGPCPGCDECLECDNPDEPPMEWYDLAGEAHFSWSCCEICESHLGGDRYPVHAVDKNDNILHFDVCTDCYYYVEYGVLDDQTMSEIEED